MYGPFLNEDFSPPTTLVSSVSFPVPVLPSSLGAAATPAELRQCLIEKLRMVLASGSDEECSVCLDSVRLPVITHCAHVYCRPCIAQVISTEKVMYCF